MDPPPSTSTPSLKRSLSPTLSPSPSKRQRTLTLKPLPLPLLLITLSTSLYKDASSLYPYLPSHYPQYHQLLAASISLLRRAINLNQGGKLELRARVMLVEILGKVGGKGNSEVDKVIAKGIATSQSHEALTPYKHLLTTHHATLTPSTKFAKTTLRRLCPPSSSDPSPQYTYHHLLQTYSISASLDKDFPAALSSLREVERIAGERGDEEMVWAGKVLRGRLALGEGRMDLVREVVEEVAGAWWGIEEERLLGGKEEKGKSKGKEVDSKEVVDKRKEELCGNHLKIGRGLRIQFLMVYCLFWAQMGFVKKSKERLKIAHQLLDEKVPEEGEIDGWIRIGINPSKPGLETEKEKEVSSLLPNSTSVTLKIAPRSEIYSFAFLVSVAVHRDPFGSKPRSVLFSTEGLRTLDLKLSGAEALPRSLSPTSILTTLSSLAQTKLHLHLFSAELAIMRSSPPTALTHLESAITCARTHYLFPEWSSRITLVWGLMAVLKGDEEEAEDCFEVVRWGEDEAAFSSNSNSSTTASSSSPPKMSRSSSSHRSPKSSLWILASFSLLLLRLSLKTKTSQSALAAEILSSLPPPGTITPDLMLVAEVLKALTKGEIIKAKAHLSAALGLANEGMRNHAKALLLALLANLFLFTRNDQAQKMLAASYHITRGMGSRPDPRTPEEKLSASQSSVLGDDVVGNAVLGLWVGEKLLEGYRKEGNKGMCRKQEALNEAHRRVLRKEREGGMA